MPVYSIYTKIMENIDYILLFNKFLQKEATREEVSLLIQGLKDEGAFHTWTDEQWKSVSPDMDPDLQQKLLGHIKGKIQQDKCNIQEFPIKRKSMFYQWTIRVAAVILLLLATSLGVYQYTKQQMSMPDMVVSVDKGQKANMTLPDGSKVWINSDSKLSYGSHFNFQERMLHLDGEAYFEVAPDKKRPFIVKTGEVSIKALGTSFNVKAYRDEKRISAVLMTGKVEVQSKFTKDIMYPNEQITIDRLTGKMRKEVMREASVYSNWRYNILRFNAETFENIVLTLERNYNTSIVFKSEKLKQYRFTGTLGNTSLESILQILSLTSPLSYEVKDGQILLDMNVEKKKKYENVLK